MSARFVARRSIRRHLIVGLCAALVLVGVVFGWAWTARLTGAVIAPGVVVVESDVKRVQHPTGGVVSEIRVKPNDLVSRGDIVVRLDDTQTKANAAIYSKSLDEFNARRARLEAERNAADTVSFPDDLITRADTDPEVAHILDSERKLFDLRGDAREGMKAQLRERANQLREEIKGLDEQISAKSEEIKLIGEELEGVLALWKKNLTSFTRVTALKRDAARLNGERGRLIAARAGAAGKIAEVELQIIQVDDEARSRVAEELGNVRTQIAQLVERQTAAQDQLKRVDIRAPQTGRVHQLSVHTIGRVISPGEVLMLIVPDTDRLSVEARIPPDRIDQLFPHQPVFLRFSAFDQRSTPELGGEVSWISPDISEDSNTGMSYYTLRVTVSEAELKRLGALQVVPGMPVEVFVQTESRTALSYFIKPLTDNISRMFRES